MWKQTWGEALNQQQAAAVQAADGPVLLLAVPGSGKTTVLIHRLGYLMDCRGIPPERILTVTYTVAATRDMRARFARTFGEDRASRLEFRTINGPFRPDHSVLRAGHGPTGFSAGHRRGDTLLPGGGTVPGVHWDLCHREHHQGAADRHHLRKEPADVPGGDGGVVHRGTACGPGLSGLLPGAPAAGLDGL